MIPEIELYFVELYLAELYLVELPSASPRSRPLTADYTALVGTPQSTFGRVRLRTSWLRLYRNSASGESRIMLQDCSS